MGRRALFLGLQRRQSSIAKGKLQVPRDPIVGLPKIGCESRRTLRRVSQITGKTSRRALSAIQEKHPRGFYVAVVSTGDPPRFTNS